MGQGPDESKRWQVWAVAVPNAVSYRLQDSRSIEAAQHVLGGYQGTVMADGYGAYSGLQNRGAKFALAHCWAHARRKFVEIEEFFPVDAQAGPLISSASSTASSDSVRLVHPVTPCAESCVILAPGRSLAASSSGLSPSGHVQRVGSARPSPTCQVCGRASPSSSTTPGSHSTTMRPSGLLRGVVIEPQESLRLSLPPWHRGRRSLLLPLRDRQARQARPAGYLSQIARAAIRAEALPLPHEMLAQQIPVAA